MRKQFQILATTIITVSFISCNKETIDKPEQTMAEEISVSKSGEKAVDPLSVNLEGWFTFDNNKKDKTGKLAEAISSNNNVIYATDRKGKPKSAIYFDGNYSLKVKAVPQQTKTSLSMWIKSGSPASFNLNYWVAEGFGKGPKIYHLQTTLAGGITTNSGTFKQSVPGFPTSTWHLVTVTYDGQYLVIYKDGSSTTSAYVGSISSSLVDYILGSSVGGSKWEGYLDDVRFYSRVLTQSDVFKIYNQ